MRIGRVEPGPVEAPAALSRLSQKLIDSSREARLEELREKVQSETYEVPAEELATRIIDSLLNPDAS